jgi:hypothetical protein
MFSNQNTIAKIVTITTTKVHNYLMYQIKTHDEILDTVITTTIIILKVKNIKYLLK